MAGQTTTGELAVGEAHEDLVFLCDQLGEAIDADNFEYVLGTVPELRTKVEELIGAAVYVARERGASWTHIGDAFGVPRQTAHRRWADQT